MKKEELYDTIEGIDEKFIDEAETVSIKKKSSKWIQWGTIAACLCLVAGVVAINSKEKTEDANHILAWNPSFTANQYFTYSDQEANNIETSESVIEPPYAESRYFSDKRSLFEDNNVIPLMDNQYDFTAKANYNSDGSLYSIELIWHQDSTYEQYSHLTVTVANEEVPRLLDCVEVEIDENGNIIEPGVTVTERDGVQIVAVGNENREKFVTFRNATGWYQITGSWNDSYESTIGLVDWFWDHPIEFSNFKMENGDIIVGSDLLEHPEAFSEYLPKLAEEGFVYDLSSIELKNGEPEYLEVHYLSNVTPEQVENGDYIVGEGGCERVHWCIDANPSKNALNGVTKIEDLSKDEIMSLKTVDEVTTETKIRFIQGKCLVTIYTSDVESAWKLIETIMK